MSSITTLLSRLFAALFASGPAQPDPDNMSLHDWADLPVHHPSGDRAPC